MGLGLGFEPSLAEPRSTTRSAAWGDMGEI